MVGGSYVLAGFDDALAAGNPTLHLTHNAGGRTSAWHFEPRVLCATTAVHTRSAPTLRAFPRAVNNFADMTLTGSYGTSMSITPRARRQTT